VNVDSSWVWIAVLVVYSLWSRFTLSYAFISGQAAFGYALFAALLFFGSVFLHEMAHAVAARLSHIQVLGITLVFFGGFTAARSDEKGPGPAFVISAVGPGTSLVLGLLLWAIAAALRPTADAWATAFGYVGFVNLVMAGFNVLPGLPLDGGRMVQAMVWRITGSSERGTRFAAYSGMAVALFLFAAAAFVVMRWNDLFFALWCGLIGMFIFQSARSSERQLGVRERLGRATVAEAMDPPPPSVQAEMSLSEALDRFLRGHEHEAFPVVESGRVIGMISFSSAREIGMQDPLRPVRDALIPLSQVILAHPDERLDAVAARLGPERSALVLREGELVGAISGSGLLRWASTHTR
jgi:Zn-dependent protease